MDKARNLLTKKLLRPIFAALLIIVSFIGCTPIGCTPIDIPEEDDPANIQQNDNPEPPIDEEHYEVVEVIEGEFRAVWVASVLNLDFPSRQGLSAAALKREIDAIVLSTANMGLNAIILQVRPTGDAFYESEIFPWSHWLSGEQGIGVPDFDPLAYWLEVCHANDIMLHAWLNPYRVIHTSTNSSDPQTLSPNNPVHQRPELAIGWTNPDGHSGLFLDPGLPEARQLIIDGIAEIIENYDLDGIHIDDYFYPGMNFDDTASFAIYGEEMELSDWRRENVNELIRGIQTVIRKHNNENGKSVRWGISPTAIWKNASSDPLGVPTTRGQESYHELYADTRLWVTEKWVDYICPQIYWYIGFENANFEAISNWWVELCEDSNVDLYIGHAAYREYEDNQAPHWQGEMIRQLEMIAESDVIGGSVFYRFHSLKGRIGRSIRSFYAKKDGFTPREPLFISDTLSVGFPTDDVTLTGNAESISGYNILGTSIPGKTLYLNGEEVTTRTEEGFFFIFAPLEQGDNVFTFSQDDEQDAIRVITVKAPTSGGSGDGTASAPVITEVTSLRYATVISNEAWVYGTNSTSDGLGYMLEYGQRDRVVALSDNNFVKLSSGCWVRADAVTVQSERAVIEDRLQEGIYNTGIEYDVITWNSDVFSAVVALYDGTTLTVSFGMQKEVPPLALPDDLTQTIFESVRDDVDDGIPFYEFTIREDVKFEGYYVEYEDGELRLLLKKRKMLSQGDNPLENITIMLDPGHGGESIGAIGPLGYDVTEKHFVVIHTEKLAERLENLGATVILTRTADVDVSLHERVVISREAQPDLFISLHVNSVAETTNAGNIRGFTVWYRNANSVAFSEVTLDIMYAINPETNRGRNINEANFYVCRPWWSPHVLYESSFIVNLDDFIWLIDPAQQDRYADAAVDVILEYFK